MTAGKKPQDLVDRLGPGQPLQEQIDEAQPRHLRTPTGHKPAPPPEDDEALPLSERQRLPESSEDAYGQEGED
ncbi:MAG: hypothetical protein AB7O56_09175 [Bauldia sp.]